jgi:multiple sugar transport system substrate-binding protein
MRFFSGRPILLLLLVGVLLVACSPASQPTATVEPTSEPTLAPTDDEPVELVVWAEWFTQESMSSDPEGQGKYGTYLKEQFEREHPGVTVRIEYQGWDEALRQNLFNALLAGTPPDIVVGENYFQFFAELGALYPLDDLIADIKDNLIPATYRAAEYRGSVYGIPAFTGIFAFERNCSVIVEAGLDCDTPPQTWDELIEQVKSITEAGNGDYYGFTLQGPAGTSVGSVFRIAVLLAQTGADLCSDADCTQPYFNNPKAVPVMELIRELNQYTPPGLTFTEHEGIVYDALFQGLSAYQIAGSWHPDWAKSAGCEDCRYSPVPIPEGGHTANMVVGNIVYAVLNQSKHPELAAEWVKLLARDDVQELVYPSLRRLPATRSALTALRPNVDQETQVFIDELLNNPELGILPQWRNYPNELWSIYNDMLTDILTTRRPIKDIMDAAQAKADEVMSRQ